MPNSHTRTRNGERNSSQPSDGAAKQTRTGATGQTTDGRTDGRTNAQTHGQTDGRTPTSCAASRPTVPSTHTMEHLNQKRGMDRTNGCPGSAVLTRDGRRHRVRAKSHGVNGVIACGELRLLAAATQCDVEWQKKAPSRHHTSPHRPLTALYEHMMPEALPRLAHDLKAGR